MQLDIRGLMLLAALSAGLLTGCARQSENDRASAARLADSADGSDWAGYGRSDGQQHFSPLTEVATGNVDRLGLAWSLDLAPGNSATQPIAVDGVLYFAAGLSVVHAVDAVSGKLLWSHDPEVGKVGGLNQRIGWGVRGVAWWNGKVYVGTRDGRLIALDAKTGRQAWSVQTFAPDQPAYISGAPRAFGGRILIGSASTVGAMRGYVAAYDAETGKELWRFHTVPGNPANGFENKAMERAAQTWSGEWWKFGGGGMVWNSMAYDPQLELVYVGVGSHYPWSRKVRSQDQGDNLYATSILALDVKSGAYRWHYQTVPGDTWDFDATMDIELAELILAGKQRKVLMQAPKNGFFYVLDRATGELLAAHPYTEVNWASRIDLKTGRPVENPAARYDTTGRPFVVTPTPLAGHNWLPMAFSPQTRLAYVPVVDWKARVSDLPVPFAAPKDRTSNGGFALVGGPLAGMAAPTGRLIAFDPLTGKTAWQVRQPTYINGGVLATAGGLVFQGTVDGKLTGYDATTGAVRWQFDTRAPLIAPPIAFRAGGRQYVTVLTGLGMAYPMNAGALIGPQVESYGIDPLTQARRVLTFAIGGKASLPARREPAAPPPDPGFRPDPARIAAGGAAFSAHCATCHGELAVGIGNGPDLRRSGVVPDAATFDAVLREGLLEPRGMPRFAEFPAAKVEAIRHYLRARAADLRAGRSGSGQPASLTVR